MAKRQQRRQRLRKAGHTVGGRVLDPWRASEDPVRAPHGWRRRRPSCGRPGIVLADERTSVATFLTSWLGTARTSIRPRTYQSYSLHVERLAMLTAVHVPGNSAVP